MYPAIRWLSAVTLLLLVLTACVTDAGYIDYSHGGGLGAMGPGLASMMLVMLCAAGALATGVCAFIEMIQGRRFGWLAVLAASTLAGLVLPAVLIPSLDATLGGNLILLALLIVTLVLVPVPLVCLIFGFAPRRTQAAH